jgi:hypothetical protein
MIDKIASTSAVIIGAAFMGLMAITTPAGMFVAAGDVIVDVERWWLDAPAADARAEVEEDCDPARIAWKAGFHAGWDAGWSNMAPDSLDPIAEPASWLEGYYDGYANGRVGRDEHDADRLAEFDPDMLRPSIQPGGMER